MEYTLDIAIYLAIASFTWQFIKRDMYPSAVLAALIAFTYGLADSIDLLYFAEDDDMGGVLLYILIGMVVTGLSVAFIRSRYKSWLDDAPKRQAEEDRILEEKVLAIMNKHDKTTLDFVIEDPVPRHTSERDN